MNKRIKKKLFKRFNVFHYKKYVNYLRNKLIEYTISPIKYIEEVLNINLTES